MNMNKISLETVVAEIRTMNRNQIAELRAEVADSPSASERLETALRIASLDKLVDTIAGLPFERRSDALRFAVEALQVISDIRTRGGSDEAVEMAVQKLFHKYR